jgi:glycine cleavage system H protein
MKFAVFSFFLARFLEYIEWLHGFSWSDCTSIRMEVFMVAIFVLLTIVAFILVDILIQRREGRKARAAAPAPVLLDRFVIPKGYFVSRAHAWIEVLGGGKARIGIDDFVQKLVGTIDEVVAVPAGASVRKGDPLMTLRKGVRTLLIPSPLSGRVEAVNTELSGNASVVNSDPYGDGWVVLIDPTDLASELPSANIAAAATQWLRTEISRFRDFINNLGTEPDALPAGVTLLDGGVPVAGVLGMTNDETWNRFGREFLSLS